MRKALFPLTLAVTLIAAPTALHADTMMTGQFSIQGTVQNVGTTLEFVPSSLATGVGTQTGTFALLLTDGEGISNGNANVGYGPYVPGSAFFVVGPLTATLETLTETTEIIGKETVLVFSGVADLTAPGFLDTTASFSFNTPPSGLAPFVATAVVPTPPAVPEPSSLALFGTGILTLAGLASRKLRRTKA